MGQRPATESRIDVRSRVHNINRIARSNELNLARLRLAACAPSPKLPHQRKETDDHAKEPIGSGRAAARERTR